MTSGAPGAHCCEQMRHQAEHRCADHPDPYDCPDALIVHVAKFAEYGLIVRDDGSSYVQIGYCPWCGTALPESARDRWFEAVEALGLDPWADEAPEKYQDGTWLRET